MSSPVAAVAAGLGVRPLGSAASAPKVTSDKRARPPARRCARTAHSMAASAGPVKTSEDV